MTIAQTLAIAASAYNVCGPQTGDYATPATVEDMPRALVLDCMTRYIDAHDGELYTRDEIIAARAAMESL